jgi:hypothetical protein
MSVLNTFVLVDTRAFVVVFKSKVDWLESSGFSGETNVSESAYIAWTNPLSCIFLQNAAVLVVPCSETAAFNKWNCVTFNFPLKLAKMHYQLTYLTCVSLARHSFMDYSALTACYRIMKEDLHNRPRTTVVGAIYLLMVEKKGLAHQGGL